MMKKVSLRGLSVLNGLICFTYVSPVKNKGLQVYPESLVIVGRDEKITTHFVRSDLFEIIDKRKPDSLRSSCFLTDSQTPN